MLLNAGHTTLLLLSAHLCTYASFIHSPIILNPTMSTRSSLDMNNLLDNIRILQVLLQELQEEQETKEVDDRMEQEGETSQHATDRQEFAKGADCRDGDQEGGIMGRQSVKTLQKL